jgi:hypothetical protein
MMPATPMEAAEILMNARLGKEDLDRFSFAIFISFLDVSFECPISTALLPAQARKRSRLPAASGRNHRRAARRQPFQPLSLMQQAR